MCTLLLLRRPSPEIRVALMENRDHPGDPVRGEGMREIPGTGVIGHYDQRSDGLVCGLSLRSGLVAGLANVPGHRGAGDSRGRVMRDLLAGCADLEKARRFLLDRLSTGASGSAVYLATDGRSTLRCESRAGEVAFREEGPRAFATNHFELLEGGFELEASLARAERVRRFLERPEIRIEDLLGFAAEHGDGPGDICRHDASQGFTLSSSVLVMPEEGEPHLFFAPGPPCIHEFREYAGAGCQG